MASFQFNSSGQITSATITVPGVTSGQTLTLVIQNNYISPFLPGGTPPGIGDMLDNGTFAQYVHDLQGYVDQPEIQNQLGGFVDEIPATSISTNGSSVSAPANTLVIDVGPDVPTNSSGGPGITHSTIDPDTGELTALTIDVNTVNGSNSLVNTEGGGTTAVYSNDVTYKELGNAVAFGNPTVPLSVPDGDQQYSPDTPGTTGGSATTNANQVFGNTNLQSMTSGTAAVQNSQYQQGWMDENIGRSLEGEPMRQLAEGALSDASSPNAILSPNSIPDSSPVPVPSFMQVVESFFGIGQATGSPLVLDLSSDGSGITLSSVNSSGAVYWDFGSGFKNASGWVTGTTGLLCIDPTGTGVITQADLFGNSATESNGFLSLQAFAGTTGVLDASNSVFSELRVWVPSAGTDGVSQPGDLYTLAQLGITSINLSYTNEDYQISGNNIEEQSTFVINGNTQTIADAWFAYDPVNTVYDGTYTPNPAAFGLPDQRGYGELPTLDISMSLDSTLLTEVQGLASQSFSQLLNPTYGLESVIKGILYEWAGVESVNPESSWATFSGNDLNAQNLAFMSQLMGQIYQGTGNYEQVGDSNAPYYWEAWNEAFSYLAAHILAQAGFSNLMGNPVYDLSTDTLSVSGSAYDVAVQFADQARGTELSHMATNDIFVLFPGDSPASNPLSITETASGGGTNVLALGVAPSGVTVSDNGSGTLFVNYTSTDMVEVLGGMAYSGGNVAGITVAEYIQQIAFADGTVWNLADGIHLTATPGYATVFGTATGGDTLDAGSVTGAVLWAFTGDNTFIAGPEATMNAGNGTDLFVINPDSAPASSGGVTINPNVDATGDQVVLHGVTESQVFLSDNSSGQLFISTSNSDLVTITGGSLGSGGVTIGNIAGVDFDDSTVWNLTGVVTLTATGYGQSLYGLTTGTNFVADGSADIFHGYSANDIFSFTSGSSPTSAGGDTIYESATGGSNTIAFHGLAPSAVAMSDDTAGDLIFQFGTDLVTAHVGSFSYTDGLTISNLQQATFDSGTTWTFADGLNLTATSNSQTLYGSVDGGDTLTANGNYDTLRAYAGTETLVAGNGAYIYNGTGADTDVFSAGTASTSYSGDNIYANTSGGTATIAFHGIDPSAVTMWDNTGGQFFLQFSSTDLVTVNGGTFSYSTGLTMGSLQQATFDDGTTWTFADGLNLTATSNSQTLYGSLDGGDTLTAAGTYDTLHAYAGTEVLVAGAASYLYNGTGTDTDVFSAGAAPISYGGDTIYANTSGGTATIDLHGIAPSAVTMWDTNSGNLVIQYSSTDEITVSGGSFSYSTGVTLEGLSTIAFDSSYSTIWTLADGLNLTAEGYAQTIYGTVGGGDTLTAAGDYDTLHAYAGTEVLVAGDGAYLYNGTGTDTDVFSAGTASTSYGGDTIYTNTSGGTATIDLHGIAPSAVTMWDTNSGNLVIQYSSTDEITVSGGSFSYSTGVTLDGLSTIAFDSSYSTIWTVADGLNLTAEGYAQTIYGTVDGGDTLTAGNSYNTLIAFGGSETLVAGYGSNLYNGTGNDTDVFSSGFGTSTLYANASGGSSNSIVFHGVTASDLAISDNIYGQLIIHDAAGDQITVNGGSYSSSTGFAMGNIQQIVLDSGADINLQGSLNLTATGNSEALYGTGNGDHMVAQGNGDSLWAIAGNNTMIAQNSGTTNFYGGSGNDLMIAGGAGSTNYMTMGSGADTIKIESASSSTTVNGFSVANGDVINLAHVLTGYDPLADALANFVQETTSGGNTIISIDPTGTGTFTGAQITLAGVTGLPNLATLVSDGILDVHHHWHG